MKRMMQQSAVEAGDAQWSERARAELDRRVDDLDAATLSRLNRARQAALQAAPAAGRRTWLWTSVAGLAMSAALVLGIGLRSPAPAPAPSLPVASVSAQDFALLASDDNLDLYQEDLDFYAWVDQDAAAPGGT